jgi:transposase-like protein
VISAGSMGMIRSVRSGYEASAAVVRRLLALALVLEGHSRARAAETCGMDRQTLRDWVHRYNEQGIDGLSSLGLPAARSIGCSAPHERMGAIVERPAMANRTIRNDKNAVAFIEALSETGNVTHACDQAGLRRRTIYEWRDDDPAFADAWEQALEIGTHALEDEARRRAMGGSDVLLIFMLKSLRPEKYNPAAYVNVNVNFGLGGMSIEELRAELAKMLTIEGERGERTCDG